MKILTLDGKGHPDSPHHRPFSLVIHKGMVKRSDIFVHPTRRAMKLLIMSSRKTNQKNPAYVFMVEFRIPECSYFDLSCESNAIRSSPSNSKNTE